MGEVSDHRLVKLRAAHEQLAREVHDLRTWWQWQKESDQPNLGEMSRRIMQLHDNVLGHLAIEEQEGYLNTASQLRPDLAREVDELLDDHKRIRSAFEELALRLAGGVAAWASWDEPYQKLEEILAQLRQHEETESKIFEAAFGER